MYFVSAFLLIITIVFFTKWRRSGNHEMAYLAIGFFFACIGSVIVTFLALEAINMGS